MPVGAALLVACVALIGCSNGAPSAESAPDGLLALVANPDGTTLVGWDASGDEPTTITLPKGETTWVDPGLAGVLAATLADGTTATSDPLHLGKKLKWRAVKAVGPNGDPDRGPDTFASWEPGGGRYATLSGRPDDRRWGPGRADRPVGVDHLRDPARSIGGRRPAGLDRQGPLRRRDRRRRGPDRDHRRRPDRGADRRPAGCAPDRHVGRRPAVATMAGQGAPVVVRDTTGWLGGDGSSIASIEPAGGATTAIGFALDATGQRLVVAWAGQGGAVTLAIHDARADWRRVAKPPPGPGDGARRVALAAPTGGAPGQPRRRAGPSAPGPLRSQAVTGSAAAKMETWASSGSITPKTFWRVRRWTHDPQLSK